MGVCDRERAFEKLFKENYSPLYYNALYIVHDSEVARDVVNDVFTMGDKTKCIKMGMM